MSTLNERELIEYIRLEVLKREKMREKNKRTDLISKLSKNVKAEIINPEIKKIQQQISLRFSLQKKEDPHQNLVEIKKETRNI